MLRSVETLPPACTCLFALAPSWSAVIVLSLANLAWAQSSEPIATAPPAWPINDTAWTCHTIDASSQGADGVRLFDINHDGRLDIVTPWEEGGTIRIYRHPGRADVQQLWPSVTVANIASPEDASAFYATPAGNLMVVTCTEGSSKQLTYSRPQNPADVFSNATITSWTTKSIPGPTFAPQAWMFAVSGQLDNDHAVEVMAGSKGPHASITLFQAPQESDASSSDDSASVPWTDQALREAGWIMTLELVDMDDDHDLDCLYSDRRGRGRGVGWLENPGAMDVTRARPWRDHHLGASDVEVMFVRMADVTSDGRADIMVMTLEGHLRVLKAPSSATSAWAESRLDLPTSFRRGKGVACGDVNQDGHLDLMITTEDGCVGWYDQVEVAPEGISVRAFHRINGDRGWKYDLVHLLDIDEDGDLDVLTCEERHNLGVVWYENPRNSVRIETPPGP